MVPVTLVDSKIAKGSWSCHSNGNTLQPIHLMIPVASGLKILGLVPIWQLNLLP